MKILIIDDNEVNLMVLEGMLNILFPSYSVDMKESAVEALEIMDLDSYAVILSDIDMPVMDGIEFFTQAREQKQFMKPIIAITALAVSGDKDRILMHGFDAYISKPIDMNDLETTLGKYLKV